jgi:hypothetical protein
MTVRYRRAEDVRVAALDAEGVVLHLGSRRYFTVSETALAMLEALTAPRSADDLVALLCSRYDVTRERAADSVDAFLKRCEATRVVTTADRA